MADEKVRQQHPEVLAMILADSVLQDAATGKHFIQGTYSAIVAPGFPWRQNLLVVYAAITNGHGQTPFTMRLVDVDEEHPPLFESTAVLNLADPLVVVELVFAHAGAVFPSPGEYRLQLFGAGTFLRERRLQVIPLPQPPG